MRDRSADFARARHLPLFKSQFIPNLHEGHYILHMTAVPGTSEKESLRIGSRVSEAISAIKGVQSVTQWVGRAQNGADTFGTHYSEFEVEIGTLSGEEQSRILREIRETLSGENGVSFPGVNFAINTFLTERIEETISGYTAAMVINIHSDDLDALDRNAMSIAGVLGSVPGATDVQIQSPPGTPKLSIRLLPERLAQWGMMPVDVLENIQAAFEGVQAAQVYQGNRVISVNVMFTRDVRDDLREIGELPLKNPDGKIVRLKDLADITQENGRSKILHAGAKRIQTVTCNVQGRDIESFAREVKQRLRENVRLTVLSSHSPVRPDTGQSRRPLCPFAAGLRRHFPDALYRFRPLAQPAADLRQPAVRPDRRRAGCPLHRRMDLAGVAGRLRHAVRDYPT